MVQPAAEIVLSEVDVELTLLGSLFMAPGAFALKAEDINPEWFSDPFARYLYDASLKLHREGHRLSPQAVVACLPEDCGGVPRGAFYARACGNALPQASIGGLIHTLRDRWARRSIIAKANEMRDRAVHFSEDPYDIANEAILDLNNVSAQRSESRAVSFDVAMANAKATRSSPASLRGATTGLLSLDNKINGYRAGQLYVIAGRPGMGKSAFMCSSLRRTAQSGKGVAIFSLEMTADEIAARCQSDSIDNVKGPFFGNILKGMLSTSDEEDLIIATDSMAGLPMYVDDSPRLTFAEIMGKARNFKAELEAGGQSLAVICIDHMGLVTPSDRYRGNKVAEAGEVSAQARAMAKELNCCVVLLCQLSREVEKRDDKRPIMSDLRWSGEIEQDAHVIGFLYREAYYLAQDPNADPWKINDAKFKLEFLIRKNRNGETSDLRLWCSIGHSSIRDEM